MSLRHLRSPLFALTPALAIVAACSSTEPASAPAPVASLTRPIVNGQTETGWPGVGALTITIEGRYYGAYCSGTLIAPQWVLTAGHCSAGSELAQEGITPASTSFFVGNDANPLNNGDRPEGRFFQSDAFVPSPLYDTRTNENDVGLIHLAAPVPEDVPIYPYNTSDLAAFVDAWTGEAPPSLLTVGYGAVEGIHESGAGLKRSTHITIDDVIEQSYVSEFIDTGTCFGDSGGPGFLEIDGQTRIIGVTSAGGNCPFNNPNCDPCTTVTYSTRIDVYSAWITATINGPAPDCHNTPQMCLCEDACTPEGTCDDSVVCHIANCQETYFCVRQCGGDLHCQGACMEAATDEAKVQADALLTCASENCAGLSGDERRQCLNDKCPSELGACFDFGGPGPTPGDQTCTQVYDCVGGCTTSACFDDCVAKGTSAAQTQIDALLGCLDQLCADEGDSRLGFTACAHVECQAAVDACFGATAGTTACAEVDTCAVACDAADDDCREGCYDLGTAEAQAAYDALAACLGAECADDDADAACRSDKCAAEQVNCHPIEVVPPDIKDEGEVCTPTDECAQGLECTAHEGAASTCEKPCTDADDDGVCADDDCDDTDAARAADCSPVVAEPDPEVTGGRSDDGCGGGSAGVSLAAVGLALMVMGRRRRV